MSSVTSRIPLVLLTLLFFSAVAAPAMAVPPLPYELYGAITVDNVPAPVGTEITAKIDDLPVGSIFVEKDGVYGGSDTFDKRLVINANEEDIGKYITFWVGDRQATKITQMQAGASQNLDLSFIAGEEGTIDVSLPEPTSAGIVPSPTQSPLMAAPLLGLLAAAAFIRSKQK